MPGLTEGLQGKPVAEICRQHQISQSQHHQGRDLFLAHAANALEAHQHTRTEAGLAPQTARLKTLVRELTLELRTNDELGG
jgi:transposase